MANLKKPGRDAFEDLRAKVVADLPNGYGTLLRHKYPEIDLQHIYHVKAGKALDWDVLEKLEKLAKETAANRKSAAA